MEDLFIAPKKKITDQEIVEILNQHYPDNDTRTGNQVYSRFPSIKTYFEFFNLNEEEVQSYEEEEPDFWELVQPTQVICVTHKRAFFNYLKPVLLDLLKNKQGFIYIDEDEPYTFEAFRDFENANYLT
ncbi:MAG: hypothetical protein ACFB10_02645 [Salibacteraceae bacterium]